MRIHEGVRHVLDAFYRPAWSLILIDQQGTNTFCEVGVALKLSSDDQIERKHLPQGQGA
jgi:hypothetical protein